MNNFFYDVKTKIIFGKGGINKLGENIKRYSSNILFCCGSGSIKKSGLYDAVIEQLKESEINYTKLSGIKPNPRLSSVQKGIELCKSSKTDFILAVGGGSVIDCAKAIAAGFYYDGNVWDFYEYKAKIKKALPVASVLTLAASGSEMNGNSVITNEEAGVKRGVGSHLLYPVFSILDPSLTQTVPPHQTAAGTADIISHLFEQYFSKERSAYVTDRMIEAVLKTCFKFGPTAYKYPENFEARANLMWASSIGLNSLLSMGKTGDWATHQIEHQLSAVNDLTHGTGLAILTPNWMEHVLDEKNAKVFADYGRNVWNISGKNDTDTALKAIKKTREFFKSLDIPQTLREVGFNEEMLPDIARKTTLFGSVGQFKKLNEKDVLDILKRSL
ncbi:MAG: NADH-dependent alcohol dehydrogenase [Candidatus Cloacimonadota bacterium]|nr:MAG: NADH-dependent alcohol dehydrogenase [Candidatus Cloacimonadota bacterium]